MRVISINDVKENPAEQDVEESTRESKIRKGLKIVGKIANIVTNHLPIIGDIKDIIDSTKSVAEIVKEIADNGKRYNNQEFCLEPAM